MYLQLILTVNSPTVKPLIKSVQLQSNENGIIVFIVTALFFGMNLKPNIYRLHQIKIKNGVAEKSVQFGVRDFKISGTHFTVNDKPVF